jgi:hypothetical protein
MSLGRLTKHASVRLRQLTSIVRHNAYRWTYHARYKYFCAATFSILYLSSSSRHNAAYQDADIARSSVFRSAHITWRQRPSPLCLPNTSKLRRERSHRTTSSRIGGSKWWQQGSLKRIPRYVDRRTSHAWRTRSHDKGLWWHRQTDRIFQYYWGDSRACSVWSLAVKAVLVLVDALTGACKCSTSISTRISTTL